MELGGFRIEWIQSPHITNLRKVFAPTAIEMVRTWTPALNAMLKQSRLGSSCEFPGKLQAGGSGMLFGFC